MRRFSRQIPWVSVAIVLCACNDESGVQPVAEPEYQAIATIFLHLEGPPLIAAIITRTDASAAPATDCSVAIDGVVIPHLLESDADEASFSLDIPNHVPGQAYSVSFFLPELRVTVDLATPVAGSDIQISAPLLGDPIIAGDPLAVAWAYDGPAVDEFEINLYGCPVEEGEEREDYSALVAVELGDHEIPASATSALTTCDSTSIDLIARWAGDIADDLVVETSRWYVVLAHADLRLEVLQP